ncbi:MAG: hypothetical protein ACRD5K_18105 [Candidatus Acidiferrales bacterium]
MGTAQGFDPLTHTWPTLAFPFGTPLTAHKTLVSGELATVAVNDCRWPGDRVAALGVTVTVTPLVIVTVADALAVPPPVTALGVA